MARRSQRLDTGLITGPALLPAWYRPRAAGMLQLIDAFFANHVRGEGLSPQTDLYYQRALKQWTTWCASQDLDDPRAVSPEHLAAYATWLQTRPRLPATFARPRPLHEPPAAGLAKLTVNKYMRALRAFLAWGELNGYLEFSPFHRFKLKTPPLPVARAFTAAEVKRLINAIDQERELLYRNRAMVLLLWDTGMRRTELAHLELGDVIADGRVSRTVRVQGKGDKQRLLDLHPQTQRALFDYLSHERPEVPFETLFIGRYGDPLQPESVTEMVHRICRRAGLTGERLTPHSFRHGFTRAYLDQEGARVEDLQILLGHATLQMSLHYAGQAATQARRGQRNHSPVAQLNLALGKRLPRGRPKKDA